MGTRSQWAERLLHLSTTVSMATRQPVLFGDRLFFTATGEWLFKLYRLDQKNK